MMTDEDLLRSLFETATRDLHAPRARLRPGPAVRALPDRPAPGSVQRPAGQGRQWPRRVLLAGVAAVAGAAVAAAAILGFGVGAPTGGHPGAAVATGPVTPPGTAVLYRLASAVRALPTPTGRYVVQIEQQTQGGLSYLKASVIDSRTGDTWTYQRGAGVPAVLPMAPGFSPTEAQLQTSDPTDPARLRAALIAQASASATGTSATASPADLAVNQAIDALWNPLVQPALRAALVSLIASSPGVATNPHATDSRGRPAIEITYHAATLGVRLSVYLNPSTGDVLENSEQPDSPANADLAGHDVYLPQYWTDASPTVNPLNG